MDVGLDSFEGGGGMAFLSSSIADLLFESACSVVGSMTSADRMPATTSTSSLTIIAAGFSALDDLRAN